MKRRVAHPRPHGLATPVAAAAIATALAMTALVPGSAAAAIGTAPATAPLTASAAASTDLHDDGTGQPRAPRPVTPIVWGPCQDDFPDDRQCATIQVPLDHDRPNGPTIDIAVLRVPATSPDERIGSLFLNPGGPGGSGVDIAAGIADFLPAQVRARFDIVGFDPRGIARSTPLRCYDTLDEVFADLAPFVYPETAQEEDLWIAADRRMADACRRHAGPILAHMSTADVARDMDVLRQAVGDDALTYLGVSYGSMLGQTYANLFPDRVRALVIDGVIDPRAWVGEGIERWTVPFATRLRSAEGAQATLEEFFRLCDLAGPDCAVSVDAAARFAALGERLRVEPVEITHDELGTFLVTYNNLITLAASALYTPVAWTDFARLLAQLEEKTDPAALAATLGTLRVALGLEQQVAQQQEDYPNFVDGPPGVACADADNPRSYRRYQEVADDAKELFGYFGRFWHWTHSVCAVWPAQGQLDRYDGPWDAFTANPVLVVGNLFDPATGYHGAVAASELLPHSRLLTYTGWGHTAFLGGSPCVDEAVTAYLLTPTAPAGDLVCEVVGSPFDSAVARRAAAVPPVLVAAALPASVRRVLQ